MHVCWKSVRSTIHPPPPTTLRTRSILKTLNTPPGRKCAIQPRSTVVGHSGLWASSQPGVSVIQIYRHVFLVFVPVRISCSHRRARRNGRCNSITRPSPWRQSRECSRVHNTSGCSCLGSISLRAHSKPLCALLLALHLLPRCCWPACLRSQLVAGTHTPTSQ